VQVNEREESVRCAGRINSVDTQRHERVSGAETCTLTYISTVDQFIPCTLFEK